VIHRAEVVATKVPSLADDIYSVPVQLMLDRRNKSGDTNFILQNDLVANPDGTVAFGPFGGRLKSDNTIRFDISRYVQSIITKHEPNDTLRIYAPLRTKVFNSALNTPMFLRILDAVGKGRVVLGGGSYSDSTARLRLRIIYSNL
jgi:hypothetical protein